MQKKRFGVRLDKLRDKVGKKLSWVEKKLKINKLEWGNFGDPKVQPFFVNNYLNPSK